MKVSFVPFHLFHFFNLMRNTLSLSFIAVDTTIRQLYNINPQPLSVAIGAIVYMFVEPDYRKLGIGSLALEVISAIHYIQAVDFTVLVADDDGSGGLVRWYENNGYSKAPLMQNVLGSPDGKYGVAMICPVSVRNGFFQQCKVKWW
jgi:GNAT superfamily N-acetyltransferase